MSDGLRRRDFRVKNLDVSGQVTGNTQNGVMTNGNVYYVDASQATGSSGDGTTWEEAFITIQEAIDAASRLDVIYIAAKDITDFTTDPASYAEHCIIPVALDGLALVGVSRGRTQGGLPQLKTGATTTNAILTIRAPGCLVTNLGFNGSTGTGGGILLDGDDSTKAAFGTTISNCHFKNCKGPDVDDAKEGGAIQWPTVGNAWQVLITGCRFYKNTGDIILLGTSNTRPQDVVIEDCNFTGMAANTDCNIWASASGFGSININNCQFGQVPSYGANVNLYMDLQGTLNGMISNCVFGCHTGNTGTTITFKDGGSGASFPTTVHIANCYGQTGTITETGEITIA